MDDSVLVEGLQSGSPDVLDQLLARYGTEVQTVAWLILRNRQDAEDVAVETLLTALRRAGDLRDPAALRPWLLRIATNQALGLRRRDKRVVHLRVMPEDIQPGKDPTAENAVRLTLLAGVASLPVRMRAAVVLHYYSDLTVEEVAMAMGRSPNTIKSELRVALGHLRGSMADTGGAPTLPEVGHA